MPGFSDDPILQFKDKSDAVTNEAENEHYQQAFDQNAVLSQESLDEKLQRSAKQSDAEEEREEVSEGHVQSDLLETMFKARRSKLL